MEYENAQKRILEVFTQWKAPANFKIELFVVRVVRVGEWASGRVGEWASGRVGRAYAGGLRRSGGGSQGMLDLPCI